MNVLLIWLFENKDRARKKNNIEEYIYFEYIKRNRELKKKKEDRSSYSTL